MERQVSDYLPTYLPTYLCQVLLHKAGITPQLHQIINLITDSPRHIAVGNSRHTYSNN